MTCNLSSRRVGIAELACQPGMATAWRQQALVIHSGHVSPSTRKKAAAGPQRGAPREAPRPPLTWRCIRAAQSSTARHKCLYGTLTTNPKYRTATQSNEALEPGVWFGVVSASPGFRTSAYGYNRTRAAVLALARPDEPGRCVRIRTESKVLQSTLAEMRPLRAANATQAAGPTQLGSTRTMRHGIVWWGVQQF